MMAIEKVEESASIARPLKVLVPLIKEDLRQADDAAKTAGMPYYQAAGEKMLEAKPQIPHGQFRDWIKRNFSISYDHAKKYMALARESEKGFAKPFSSLAEFVRETATTESGKTYGRSYGQRDGWHAPVKEVAGQAREQAKRMAEEEMSRRQEREAQRKLALQLIEIGYKVLAQELHPDKGGSREAMVRLNAVRDRLKSNA